MFETLAIIIIIENYHLFSIVFQAAKEQNTDELREMEDLSILETGRKKRGNSATQEAVQFHHSNCSRTLFRCRKKLPSLL